MKTTAAAVVYHEYGNPADVIRFERRTLPPLAAHEVLVEVRFAPINPADLNTLEGKYPLQPPLPAVAGVEGAGTVIATGGDVEELQAGTSVLLPPGAGTWCEACVLPAALVSQLPASIALRQAAMLRINPATAWRMLHDFVDLRPGDWIVQNAANSGVGRAIIQIARFLQLRTVSLVRRSEVIPELEAEGGDLVCCDDDDAATKIRAATADAPLLLALNAVGGSSALRLANALAPGGTVVTYGAMAREPLRIPNGLLIFKDLQWRGFWISRWFKQASAEEKESMLRTLVSLVEQKILNARIEAVYRIEQAREAILHAQKSGRAGKILLQPTA